MSYHTANSVFQILYGSPFFMELSVKEKQTLLQELLQSYPHLMQEQSYDHEIGYEASWLRKKSF